MSYPYLGDFELGKTIFFPFETFNSSGASVTISGLAVTDVEVYKGASMTQRSSDAGYALVDTDGIDLDTITGIHGFTIDTSDNTDAGFYAAGNDYTVVVASVTVDSQTCNKIVGRFSLSNRAGLKPTVEGRTLDVSSGGEAGLDLSNVGTLTGAYPFLGIIDSGTAQSATATTLVLRAATAFDNDALIGATVLAFGSTQGYWQQRQITDSVLATDTVTVDTWTVTPSGTITYIILGTPPGSTTAPAPVNVVQNDGTAITATAGRQEVLLTASGLATDAVNEIQSGLATQASVDTIDNFLDTEIAAIIALLDDPRGEPGQGAPPVNPDLATKIDYIYKAWRNKSTQTSTQYSLYADDAATIDQKAACSSDGTTLTRGEVTTGP